MRPFSLLVIGVAISSTLSAGPARAASQDAEAQELADQAIFTDYLQLDFKAAESKLKRAIEVCEKGSCSRTVQAQVYRDLAVIYVTGLKRSDEGRELLVKALRLDSRVALDADLTTPELIRVFEAAQEEAARPPEEPRQAPSRTGSAAGAQPEAPAAEELAVAEAPADEAPPPSGSLDDGSADCPPDFPGCESIADEGEDDTEEEGPDLGIVNWLSAGLQQDFLMFSGGSGVCGPGRPSELSCFDGDAFQNPASMAGDAGEVGGGFRPATTRLLLGYDRVLFPNVSFGGRLGYAIGGGPQAPDGASFVPFHVELRGTYWFAPLEVGTIRPFAMAGGGLAQVDSSVTTEVVNVEGQIEPSQVTVWKKTGTGFASLGGGAMYPLTRNGGITAELKGLVLFPSSGMSVSLQAGYTHGF